MSPHAASGRWHEAQPAAARRREDQADNKEATTLLLLGANGYINEYPTGRLVRDAKLYEISAGTSEIRRMLICRELCQENA